MSAETLGSLLGWGRGRLGQEAIETAALDARLLLQHTTGVDHGTLIAEPETEIPDEKAAQFRSLVERRARHEPVSRIVGVREFYGRNFRLSPATLDPRPDTEILISVAIELLRGQAAPLILDLGTGTGAIPVTLLAELPAARAVATDVAAEALQTAQLNAREIGVADHLELVLTSWFDRVTGSFDLIVSNPPYLSTKDINNLDPEVRDWDPHRALDGGMDGLSCYRAIAKGAGKHLRTDGATVVEIGAGQAAQVSEIFAERDLELLGAHHDLAGHVRCLVFGKPKNGGWKRP